MVSLLCCPVTTPLAQETQGEPEVKGHLEFTDRVRVASCQQYSRAGPEFTLKGAKGITVEGALEDRPVPSRQLLPLTLSG